MQGSLRLHGGVLYVGRHALTAEVSSHDLDGRVLETRLRFRDDAVGRSSVDGLDVDADRRIWVADGAARRVRCFSLFGREVASVADEVPWLPTPRDGRGLLGRPVDLRVLGTDDDTMLLVASGGTRRHALQVLHVGSGRGRSLPPMGDPESRFRGIRGIDVVGSEVAVCEAGARRVQLFEGELPGRLTFRFAFAVPEALGDPEAVALAGDGRVLVATAGEVSGIHVFDGAGRHRGALTGGEGARVDQPSALALEAGSGLPDRRRRLAVLDRDGERVQVMSLDGRPFGSFGGFTARGALGDVGTLRWDEGESP